MKCDFCASKEAALFCDGSGEWAPFGTLNPEVLALCEVCSEEHPNAIPIGEYIQLLEEDIAQLNGSDPELAASYQSAVYWLKEVAK